MFGKIVWVRAERGFGYITGEDGHVYYMNRAVLDNFELTDVRQGQPVAFEASHEDSPPRAIVVRLLA
jgi:cold shock CspA family protein